MYGSFFFSPPLRRARQRSYRLQPTRRRSRSSIAEWDDGDVWHVPSLTTPAVNAMDATSPHANVCFQADGEKSFFSVLLLLLLHNMRNAGEI